MPADNPDQPRPDNGDNVILPLWHLEVEPPLEDEATDSEPNVLPLREPAPPVPEEPVAAPPSLARLVEAMLFVAAEPLTDVQAAEVVRGLGPSAFQEAVDELNRSYRQSGRPYLVERQKEGYRLTLRPTFRYVGERLYGGVKEARLAPAAVETLAVVAYRQPVTKTAIDTLRGEDSGPTLRQLLRRGLVAVETKDTASKADIQYGTTPRFLEFFSLHSMDDLPRVDDLQRL